MKREAGERAAGPHRSSEHCALMSCSEVPIEYLKGLRQLSHAWHSARRRLGVHHDLAPFSAFVSRARPISARNETSQFCISEHLVQSRSSTASPPCDFYSPSPNIGHRPLDLLLFPLPPASSLIPLVYHLRRIKRSTSSFRPSAGSQSRSRSASETIHRACASVNGQLRLCWIEMQHTYSCP